MTMKMMSLLADKGLNLRASEQQKGEQSEQKGKPTSESQNIRLNRWMYVKSLM